MNGMMTQGNVSFMRQHPNNNHRFLLLFWPRTKVRDLDW